MNDSIKRDHGTQPLDALLQAQDLSNHDLVATNPSHLTHKMIQKARKGRYLKRQIQDRIRTALQACLEKDHQALEHSDLFNYRGPGAA